MTASLFPVLGVAPASGRGFTEDDERPGAQPVMLLSHELWASRYGASARTGFTMLLMMIAAGVALLLGTIGIYGVVSYVVSQRTQEIGVRMALGADRGTVSRMVVLHGLGMALAGIAVGLAGAFALTRLLASFLFGVGPTDPLTFGAVCTVLLATTLVASYLPARRAASVDPLVALRYE